MKVLSLLASVLILVASAGVTPVHAACGATYTVGKGESLYSIAQKCNLRYWVLININYEISDPDLIRPGQVIRLAAEEPLDAYNQPVEGPDQPDGLQPDGIYIVRPGDSLARIAYLYSTTIWELQQVNPELGGGTTVRTGQAIRLPSDARRKKGWVGVSALGPAFQSTIQVRVVDFPSYAPVQFRLHELNSKEASEGNVDAGPEDIVRSDNFSIFVKTTTDARGSARVSIKLPNWAAKNETWVVDCFTDTIGEEDVLARSPVMVIGKGY